MAFHQPTRQAMQRALRPAADEREAPGTHSSAIQQDLHPDQSQTWVLFSPVSEGQTASDFSETLPSVQNAARSHLSDIGSLHTAARLDQGGDGFSAEPSEIGQDQIEDDAELDSLDSHLPSFRSVPGHNTHSQHDSYHAVPVLPGHDGLGSFHLDNLASGPDAQNQIYQFEKFNPRRIRRRRESLDRIPLEPEHEHVGEAEKRHRIEAWRLEHSRVLLEEIQRETRRRRRSQSSLHHVQTLTNNASDAELPAEADSEDLTWHDEDATTEEESGSVFSKLTQKVIKDLLGIDDRLLSILLGNTVIEDEELSRTPKASQLNNVALPTVEGDTGWRDHLVDVVSRELGLLVNQLSEHPGAFSTFSEVQQMSLPYAGLPVIPEIGTPPANHSSANLAQSKSTVAAEFQPTVNAQTRPITISGRQADAPVTEDISMEDTFTKDEWEQDLDIKLVFKYIRSRFTSRTNNAAQSSTVHHATSNTQDAAAKAARVRQHHPLISRARPTTERRVFKATAPSSPAVALRHQSSCASQSTRRSARRSSGSSRHYWDIGGSLGTGSMIASHNGPMGSWGEV